MSASDGPAGVSKESTALQDFKCRCLESGLQLRQIEGVDDDVTLLRFIRGKALNVDQAFQQFKSASIIRERAAVLETYDRFDVEEFESMRRLYPHWTGRRDRNGSPICIFDIAALDSSTMNTYKASRGDSLDAVINGIGKPSAAATNALVFHDFLSRFILPLCSAMSGQGQPSGHGLACLYLVDISSLSLRQSWTLKEYTLDISKILANCYPEMIDRVFVIGAPRYFGAIWKLLKGWIDPVTAAKLDIIPDGKVIEMLSERIDVASIPDKYGGQFRFDHGMPPKMDLGTVKHLRGESLSDHFDLRGPFKWFRMTDGKSVVVAVGTEGGKPRSNIAT